MKNALKIFPPLPHLNYSVVYSKTRECVDLLYFKQGADVGIDMIITGSIVDFRIDQVGETCSSINDNLLGLLAPIVTEVPQLNYDIKDASMTTRET